MKLNLSQFINKNQLQILRDFCKGEEAEKNIEELEAKLRAALEDLEDAEAEIKSLKSARPRMIRPVFKRLSRPKKRLTQSIDYDFSLEQNNNLLACFV